MNGFVSLWFYIFLFESCRLEDSVRKEAKGWKECSASTFDSNAKASYWTIGGQIWRWLSGLIFCFWFRKITKLRESFERLTCLCSSLFGQGMFMDMKLNPMQHSIATLQKLCQRYHVHKDKNPLLVANS